MKQYLRGLAGPAARQQRAPTCISNVLVGWVDRRWHVTDFRSVRLVVHRGIVVCVIYLAGMILNDVALIPRMGSPTSTGPPDCCQWLDFDVARRACVGITHAASPRPVSRSSGLVLRCSPRPLLLVAAMVVVLRPRPTASGPWLQSWAWRSAEPWSTWLPLWLLDRRPPGATAHAGWHARTGNSGPRD